MEKILDHIDGVKPGLSASDISSNGSWTILFTDKAMYFIRTKNPIAAIGGMFGGALGGYVVKKAFDAFSKKEDDVIGEDISNFLSKAQAYFVFTGDELDKLKINTDLFLSSSIAISFSGEELSNSSLFKRLGNKQVKMKMVLKKDQYDKFRQNCSNFYSYDISKAETA